MEDFNTKYNFKPGDKVIWDSHFGYDVCLYRGPGVMYYTFEVEMLTGVIPGSIASFSVSEIFPYSEELYNELKIKYNYQY